jgi:hypothetical protein
MFDDPNPISTPTRTFPAECNHSTMSPNRHMGFFFINSFRYPHSPRADEAKAPPAFSSPEPSAINFMCDIS